MLIESEKNYILKGNCENILKEIPNDTFDACITDPPFGIGFEYEKKEEINDPEEYGKWIKPIYKEIERVVKPGGFIAIFQSGKYFRHLWEWFGDDIFIYGACKNFLQIRKSMPINFGFDPVAIKYLKGSEPLRPQNPKRNLNFYIANTAKEVSKTWNISREHPCPRPLDQVRELVKNFVIKDGFVLDCFFGSGTTGVACKQSKRYFLGIERDEKYIDIAKRRIAEEPECTRKNKGYISKNLFN